MELTIKSKIFDQLNDEEFYQFCLEQEHVKIERNPDKTIQYISPSYPESSSIILRIAAKMLLWNEQTHQGKVFESSAGFYLPNGAMRSTDCSFVSLQQWQRVREDNPKNFPYLVPEFIVEVRSFSDTLNALQVKMQEWIDNGVLLGWLVDVKNKTVYVYKPAQEILKIGEGETLRVNEVMPGFSKETDYIFDY